MRITRLKLTNVRAIAEAELHFEPGFNLIVGVNGVGKTSVLQAISRSLATAIQAAQSTRTEPRAFTAEDVRYGSSSASIVVEVQIGGKSLEVTEDIGAPLDNVTRPGAMASEVDVHAKNIRRRGRLKQAQREAIDTPIVQEGPHLLPKRTDFKAAAATEPGRLIAVYFGTSRATAPERRVKKSRAQAADKAAYAEAFVGRNLELPAFADWIAVLEATVDERPDAKPILTALNNAVQRFVPGYTRICVLHDSEDDPPELHIERSEVETISIAKLGLGERQRVVHVRRTMRTHMDVNWQAPNRGKDRSPEMAKTPAKERERIVTREVERAMPGYASLRGPFEKVPAEIVEPSFFDEFLTSLGDQFEIDRLPQLLHVDQLSDGERGSLALVLDLTRRLAQANPQSSDPAAESEAVVLIDELELHLHPKWQRQIVDNLAAAFPKCQFIATTHSPQVIGAVSHTGVTLLIDGGPPIRPAQTFGMDSNWILRHIMEADEREPEIQKHLNLILKDIRKGSISAARKRTAALRAQIGETVELASADAMASRAEILREESPSKKKRKKKSGGR